LATTSNAIGNLRLIAETKDGDIRKATLKALGNLKNEKVFHSQVLVATWAGSQYHPGTKVLKTDKALQESLYQGSIGIVIAVGPGAFKDQPGAPFFGQTVKVGDYVLVRPSDGLRTDIRGVPCRLFEDVNIKMVVSDPEIYW
jgi:co-chaperonin GroES (HSP10)